MSSSENQIIAEQRQITKALERLLRHRSTWGAGWTYGLVAVITFVGTILLLAAIPRIGG